MHKIIKCTVLLVALHQTFQAMNDGIKEIKIAMNDGIKEAKIENGIIAGATHYHLISGGTTMVYGLTPQPVEVWNDPRAFFHGYDHEKKRNDFLGSVTVKSLNEETIKELDKLIDPQSTLPVIQKAVIAHCIKRGRYVALYDKNNNIIDTYSHYNGSIDIKSEKNNIRLIKPHSLLNNLQEVEETQLSKNQYWFMALISPSYDKTTTIKYK